MKIETTQFVGNPTNRTPLDTTRFTQIEIKTVSNSTITVYAYSIQVLLSKPYMVGIYPTEVVMKYYVRLTNGKEYSITKDSYIFVKALFKGNSKVIIERQRQVNLYTSQKHIKKTITATTTRVICGPWWEPVNTKYGIIHIYHGKHANKLLADISNNRVANVWEYRILLNTQPPITGSCDSLEKAKKIVQKKINKLYNE